MVGGLILCGHQSPFLGMFYRRGPASQEEPHRREDGVWLRAAVRESKVLILSPSLIRSDVFML